MCPHDMIDGDGTQVIKGILFSPFRIFFTKWVLHTPNYGTRQVGSTAVLRRWFGFLGIGEVCQHDESHANTVVGLILPMGV
jgi:hypothetical protein